MYRQNIFTVLLYIEIIITYNKNIYLLLLLIAFRKVQYKDFCINIAIRFEEILYSGPISTKTLVQNCRHAVVTNIYTYNKIVKNRCLYIEDIKKNVIGDLY